MDDRREGSLMWNNSQCNVLYNSGNSEHVTEKLGDHLDQASYFKEHKNDFSTAAKNNIDVKKEIGDNEVKVHDLIVKSEESPAQKVKLKRENEVSTLMLCNLSHKADYDDGDSERKVDEVRHGDEYRTTNVTLAFECYNNIKQEVIDAKCIKLEYDEHDITARSADSLETEVTSSKDVELLECHLRDPTEEAKQIITPGKRESYQCRFCTYRTLYKRNLIQHFTVKHDEEAEWYRCQICDFRTKHEISLKRHFTAKHDTESEWWRCTICDFKTKDKRYLKQHFAQKHDEKAEWYQCEMCDYKTKNRGNYKRHSTIKHEAVVPLYDCKICDFKTKDKWYLRRHFTTLHDDKAEWHRCPVCNYVTKYKFDLRKHLKVKHDENGEWYRCQICDFKTKYEVYFHGHYTAKHDEKAEFYQCHVCDFRTKHTRSLKRHLKQKHSGIT